MASVMVTVSEVFGSCDVEINVSVEVENNELWLCCGWKYIRLIVAGKVARVWQWRQWMLPGIGEHFGRYGSD